MPARTMSGNPSSRYGSRAINGRDQGSPSPKRTKPINPAPKLKPSSGAVVTTKTKNETVNIVTDVACTTKPHAHARCAQNQLMPGSMQAADDHETRWQSGEALSRDVSPSGPFRATPPEGVRRPSTCMSGRSGGPAGERDRSTARGHILRRNQRRDASARLSHRRGVVTSPVARRAHARRGRVPSRPGASGRRRSRPRAPRASPRATPSRRGRSGARLGRPRRPRARSGGDAAVDARRVRRSPGRSGR